VDDAASLESLREIESRLSQVLGHTNQRRLEQVLNSLPEGIAVTGPDGKVRFANRALCALVGRGEPATLGEMSIGALLGLDTDESMASIRDRLKHSRGEASFLVQRGADPAAGVWSMARYPLVTDESSDAFVWAIRDVTQQKLAEEARNQFVFTATHELRTPLANILAYSETLSLAEDIDVERQKQFYNILHNEATRLSRFIDELLSISQMQAGALTVARFETDIERLLAEVDEKIEGQVALKAIAFSKSLPAKLPKLHADKDKIAAALVNLLANAIKYTPEKGQVRLIVEATGETIQFHVEDTGIGIAPDELPKVFDKFFRSSDRRVQDVPGSGIGLAFTQEVARLHGGTLTVQSELDKGSRFTLCLPRIEASSPAPGRAESGVKTAGQ
jgi:PAS domain S-box-containing protein